jgi:hypothetical protein
MINRREFENLKVIKDIIHLHKVVFPRNCLTWTGSSLLTNYEKINLNKFTITKEMVEIDDSEIKKIIEFYK